MSDKKEPKDLGVKMGTPEEAGWKRVMDSQKETALNSKINAEIADTLVELAEKKISEEKEKFKKM